MMVGKLCAILEKGDRYFPLSERREREDEKSLLHRSFHEGKKLLKRAKRSRPLKLMATFRSRISHAGKELLEMSYE